MPEKRERPAELSTALTTEMAAVWALRNCRSFIASQIDLVRTSDDIEGAHQLRVGLRRLRSVLGFFRPVIGGRLATSIGVAAKNLGHSVGRIRDLDVFVTETLPKLAPSLSERAYAAILERFEAERACERERLRTLLGKDELTRYLGALDAFIDRRKWLAPTDFGQTERLAEKFGGFTQRRLDKRWKTLTKCAHHLSGTDDEQRHQFRKDLKKLRYAVDLVAPILHRKTLKPFIKRLKKLQDKIGVLNDVIVARELLMKSRMHATRDDAYLSELQTAIARLEAESSKDLDEAEKLWCRLAAEQLPWRR